MQGEGGGRKDRGVREGKGCRGDEGSKKEDRKQAGTVAEKEATPGSSYEMKRGSLER